MKKNKLQYLPYVVLLAMLPVMVMRDFTPSNELRYLSIADEALAQGHLFAFSNHGVPYADKPPLYIWIIMLGKSLFGRHSMLFLSLFSLIPAAVIIRTMDRWVRTALPDNYRLTAAAMLFSSGLFMGLSVFLRMDMLMCMFITLALRSFWLIYTGEGNVSQQKILLPLWTFLSLFTKGPVGLLVPLLSTVAFLAVTGKLRTVGRYWGWRSWGIIIVGCVLWFSQVWIDGGTDYLNNLLFHQTIDRAVAAFHHKEPFYYYLMTMWYVMAPWSLLTVGVMIAAAVGRVRLTQTERFFLTVIVTTFVMLSAFSSKIAVYMAPTTPFFVYMAVSLMPRVRINGWLKLTVALPAVVLMASLAAVVVLSRDMDMLRNVWCYAAAALLSVAGVWSLVSLWRGADIKRPINIIVSGMLAAVFAGGLALPRLNGQIGYGDLCRQASSVAARTGTSDYYVWRMHRPENMDVYLGREVKDVSAEENPATSIGSGVLMLPERKLKGDEAMQAFVADKKQYRADQYIIVEIP